MRTRALVASLLLLVVSSCDDLARIDASGTIVSEVRDVGSFDRVDASQGVNVRVIVDPAATPSVTVNYDDNVIGDIATRVDGDILKVRLDASVSLAGGGERYVEVIVPVLAGVAVTNGANLSGEGAATALEIEGSGGGNIDLSGLEAESATVDLDGGANAILRVPGSIAGHAANGANLVMLGDPERVDVEISGGANVTTG